jgi:SAM-dependent methyltransferase
MSQTINELLLWVLFVVGSFYLMNQVRKPDRWIGRFFLWTMNLSHSSLTDWGLKHVQIEKDLTILDVGCGGGRTIQKEAAIATEGMVYGVDYSEGSVAAASAKNAQSIKSAHVEIKKASVSQLPFPNEKFDLITAVETHYYWPHLVKDMQEILRVLKPGGTLILIAESYKHGKYDQLQQWVMKPLRTAHLSVDEHRELFSASGFSDVQIFEEQTKGWICGTGKKPL